MFLFKALPIFMDEIIPAWFTILMSAPLVTVFAEVTFVLINAAKVIKIRHVFLKSTHITHVISDFASSCMLSIWTHFRSKIGSLYSTASADLLPNNLPS